MRNLRLEFWGWMFDLANVAYRRGERALWKMREFCLDRVGDATDWGEGADMGDDVPF